MVWNELNEVFGDSNNHCSIEDASRLKYLEACIKESLRLYPSVPTIERTISEDVEVDGYQIPAGVSISLLFYALHRNEDLYPDALKFKPERFMQQHEEGSVQKHPYAFVPFSAGPRNCIGICLTNYEN
jgi:cytochrome P450 family 4